MRKLTLKFILFNLIAFIDETIIERNKTYLSVTDR